MKVKIAIIVVLCLFAIILVRFILMAKASQEMTPKHLGLNSGQFQEGPDKPNWVSSQASSDDAVHHIEPIRSNITMDDLVILFDELPNAKVVSQNGNYVHIEYKSPLFGFVDDLQLLVGEGVLQVKSSSRVGYSDMSANRKRVEDLRSKLQSRD